MGLRNYAYISLQCLAVFLLWLKPMIPHHHHEAHSMCMEASHCETEHTSNSLAMSHHAHHRENEQDHCNGDYCILFGQFKSCSLNKLRTLHNNPPKSHFAIHGHLAMPISGSDQNQGSLPAYAQCPMTVIIPLSLGLRAPPRANAISI